MNITDELRGFATDPLLGYASQEVHAEVITAIADRIDEEHQKAIRELNNLADRIDSEHEHEMEERADRYSELRAKMNNCYIELQKDADNEYIHEHDKVDWRDHAGAWHENATVVAVCNDGCYVMDGTVFHVHKSDIRHHHSPTVEDVLHNFICDVEEDVRDEREIIAEYAAKLRLAEVDDASSKVEVLDSSNCANNEPTSDELNPCPFCGGIPMVDCGYHYDYDGGDRWYVYSADVVCGCGCTLHVDNAWPKEYVNGEHSLDFAIAAWNRRAEHD